MKDNSLGVMTTNFNRTPVERRPTSGRRKTIFVTNPPRVRTSIGKNQSPRLELMNQRKPTFKKIFHVPLSMPFCTIQKYILNLTVPDLINSLGIWIISNVKKSGMHVSSRLSETLQESRGNQNSSQVEPTIRFQLPQDTSTTQPHNL